ncbi:TlpA family protein disulfide reductase [Hymenobacter fodinae]|nr:TlpA disulfide reductase family protein [Hymenobacter fodinae]
MNERAKLAGIEFHARIKNTITRPDTIIHEYILSGTPTRAAELAHKQKLQTLVGQPLPPFTLTDLRGAKVSSKSLLGKQVVLNLWFTSCGPCIVEMPYLNQIQQDQAQSGVAFLAVTFDSQEKVQAFLKKRPYTFRHLVGAKDYCDQFTTGYPTTFFVDKSGIIRSVQGSLKVKYDRQTHQPTGVDSKEFYEALKLIK